MWDGVRKRYVLGVLASGQAFLKIQLIDQDFCAYHRAIFFPPEFSGQVNSNSKFGEQYL